MRRKNEKTNTPNDEVFEFQSEPGHLVRRLHQIATSIFVEQSKHLDITPIQFATLNAIARHSGYDQRQIARFIAIDRTTINIVTRRLEEKGWLTRVPVQRRLNLLITPAGEAALQTITECTSHHADELMAPLSAVERARFLSLLKRLVEGNNTLSRVPVSTSKRSDV